MEVIESRSWVHCGREFSAADVAEICTTVAWLPGLARQELAATLCEHLSWLTLTGTAKIDACLEFLARLQAAGLLVLPALRPSPPRRRLAVAWGDQRARAGPPRPVLSQHAPPGVGQAAEPAVLISNSMVASGEGKDCWMG
ncbi:conserved hypothetical protein [Candidatus Accumulibacter aalborgensis]|uniref:Uncharacterized protein n=1 Tax=Candidatus Accumulibacter aalborgensis TaxID=1860102 RepID=A0A1A8XGW1_9PROT|nr:conserved hypothetical protein [Candidatus Accumulibacter aalborgensis]